MTFKVRAITLSALWIAVAGLAALGTFHPLDRSVSELRFSAASRPATGSIVVVDIDSASLSAVGVWPWPRSVYAQALDTLSALGSAEVAFDVDFSSRSDETNDGAFEAALEATGGYAYLAGFQQVAGESGQTATNLPLERFRRHAPPVGVNVITDPGGIVHSFPAAMVSGTEVYPSLAAALSGVSPDQAEVFIDFAIDPRTIDRIPFIDLLNNTVDPTRISNKQVVIGSTALELRDIFSVPRFGTLPGPVIQVLGAETLKQGRALVNWGFWAPMLLAIFVASFLFAQRALRLTLRGAVAGVIGFSVAVELIALLLQSGFGIIVATVPLHAAVLSFVIALMAQEVVRRQRLHAQASRERDMNRMILDRVIADNFDGVVVVDETGTIVAASRLAEQLLGEGRPVTGRAAVTVLPPLFFEAVESALRQSGETGTTQLSELELTLGGRRYDFEFTVTLSMLASSRQDERSGSNRHVACLTFHDITTRRQGERRLTYLASHDALTGALSRRSFVERTAALLASPDTSSQGLTILVLDLTRFRLVNETLGHAHGDIALRETYKRLTQTKARAIARMGGDHFALAVDGAQTEAAIAELSLDLIARITEPYHLGEHRAVLGAKIGATTTDLSGTDAERLLSHADMALSAAKTASGNVHSHFSPTMDAAITEKQTMEVALRNALALSQLSLVYQPQVSLETGLLTGVEALVRWNHPTLGAISPAKFIPLAEETGLVVELGRWILQTACREFASWPAWIKLAVNVSPVQFELSDVTTDVSEALKLSGLPPARLDVEITEGIFVSHDTRISKTLEALRLTGVGVALDDFGTGYSSLSYLGRLPIDKIKIDQSFVRSLPGDGEAEAIITAMLTLSRSLGKTVVAEGIETEEQRRMLHSLGCEIGQGYLFGRPESAAAIASKFLSAENKKALALAG